MKARNKHSQGDQCSKDILETEDAKCLSKWLSLFTIEVRKKDGSKYLPASIHLLLCGLCAVTTAVLLTFLTKKTYVFEDFTVQWNLCFSRYTAKE